MKNLNLKRQNKGGMAQEEFAHKLLEYSAVPTFVIDSRHRVILWNKACEELTGMKAAEVLGSDDQWKPFYSVKRPVLADIVMDGATGDLSSLYSTCARSPLTPDGLQAERWSESLNGKDRYIIFDAAPVRDNQGRIIAAIQTLRDITVRKRIEESLSVLSLAIEQSSTTVLTTDLKGVIEYVNPSFTKVTGFSPEEAIGQTPRILKSGRHTAEFYKELWDTIMCGDEWRGEMCNKKKNGGVYWEKATISPVKNAAGKITHFVADLEDITERKWAEEELFQAKLYLSDKNRQLENERDLAHKVMECILPRQFELPGFTTAIMFRPSSQMGGDFFDAWSGGDCTHFLIGDISGHSTSAALMMAVSKGIFRSLGYSMNDPAEIVGAANRMLCPMMLDSRMFLTLVYCVFDRRDNTACFVSAGHNPVYRLDGNEITTIDSTGPAIGWDVEDAWESVRCRFDPGMLLFLYTDGLSEARDAAGREFGNELPSALAGFRSPQALVDGVFSAAERFNNGTFEDDVTIFAISRERL